MASVTWTHITRKITTLFDIDGCFLFNRHDNEWVGELPPSNFQNYLLEQYETKGEAYFAEVRFFKLAKETKKTRASYLALVPMEINNVPYQFLGLIYRGQDQLQDLLRFRILPMYLIFYVHRLVAEARVRNAEDEGKPAALVAALEENSLYAQQLENRVKSLNDEIERVKNAGMSAEEKVHALSALLDNQAREYQQLADSYQGMYEEIQKARNEHLQDAVGWEYRINDLERENAALQRAVKEETGRDDLIPREKLTMVEEKLADAERDKVALSKRIAAMERTEATRAPKRLMDTAKALKAQMEHYRQRCALQDQKIKTLRAKLGAIADSGPETGSHPGEATPVD